VDLTAGEAVSQIVPLPPAGGARLVARIEAEDDALPEDNEAVAWLEGAEAVAVTVVSHDPSALAPLLQQDPSLTVSFVTPAAYAQPASGIVIFDRWVPAESPLRPALVIAPPAASWLGRPGAEEKEARWVSAGSHPIMAGVDASTVEVKRVRGYEGPDLTPLARTVRGTPLVEVIESRDRRLVLWTFVPADTNLAAAPGFPVLFGNTIEWLARPSYGVLRKPGPIRLPASTTRVVSPDGRPVTVYRTRDSAVARLTSPGLYLVEAAGSRGVVGVNIGDPDVSNLNRSSLSAANVAQVAAGGAGWPWWLWAIVVAFVLVSAEWWTWQRRVTV
jgi:hypothetical protein